MLPLSETLIALKVALERLVIVSPLTKPVGVNDVGVILVVPLYSPVTTIPKGAGVTMVVIPLGCTKM